MLRSFRSWRQFCLVVVSWGFAYATAMTLRVNRGLLQLAIIFRTCQIGVSNLVRADIDEPLVQV